MKKFRRALTCMFAVSILVFMQMSSALVAFADSLTALKVSDIGDKNLYAVLATLSGSEDGILYKEKAEQIKDLGLSYSSTYESVEKIESFDNLSTYCPNISSISSTSRLSETALQSLMNQIIKMNASLKSIDFSSKLTQEEFDNLCSNNTGLTELRIYNVSQLDLSGISKLSELQYFYIGGYSINISGESAISQLSKLNNMTISVNSKELLESLVKNVPSSVTSLSISEYSENLKAYDIDVSKFTNLTSLYVSGKISAVNGINKLEKLDSLQISNNNSAAEEKAKIDVTNFHASELNSLTLVNCNLGTNNISFLPAGIEDCDVEECNINDLSGIESYTNLKSLRLENNGITNIPDMSKLSYLYNLDLSKNNITDMSSISGLKELTSLNLSDNHITDIGAISKLDGLSFVDLSYNQIETLPDLTGCDNLAGTNSTNYSFNSNHYYKFILKGNKLTEAAVKGKVPAGCSDDKYWMYVSTLIQRGEDGEDYFTKLDDTLLTKLLEKNNTIYTSQKEITISAEVLSYLRDNNKDVYIKGIAGGEAIIHSSQLSSDLDTLTIEIPEVEHGTTCEELTQAFKEYGTPVFYYKSQKFNSTISGLTYSAGSSAEVLDSSKRYNKYKYNPETHTFALETSVSGTSSVYFSAYQNDSSYYFYVEADKDKLTGYDTYTYQSGDDTYRNVVTYYKVLNDNIVNGIIDNNAAQTYLSAKTSVSELNLSAETVNKLKTQGRSFEINGYDTSMHASASKTSLYGKNLVDGTLSIKLPKVTMSLTNAEIEGAFQYGKPSLYLTVEGNETKTPGVSSEVTGPTAYYFWGNSYVNNNIYKYADSTFIPIQTNVACYNTSIDAYKSATYFIVPTDKDQFTKSYDRYNYYADTSSKFVKGLIENGVTSISTVDDNYVLSADIVSLLKEKGQLLRINFLSADKDSLLGYADVYGHNLASNKQSEDMKIERPDVDISTSNATLSKYFNPGENVIYVTAKNNMFAGVSYYFTNTEMLSQKFENNGYVGYKLSDNNQMRVVTSSSRLQSYLQLHDMVYAYIANTGSTTPTNGEYYATPTDDNGGTVTPPTDDNGGAVTPPTDDNGGSITTPTDDNGGTVTPPTDDNGGTVTPPTDDNGGTVTPPIDDNGGTVTPPTDDNGGTVTPSTDVPTNVPTNEDGYNSVAKTISDSKVVNVNEVVSLVENKIATSVLPTIETFSKVAAPTVTSDIFNKMKENQKNVSVGVTDENNRLKYSWTFNYDTLTNPNMNIDLSMSFDTDRANKVKEITGRDDVMYLSFAHHGALPGPATMKTYVGNQYKNGDVVYLYYFNEEKNRVETVGDGNGLVVNAGYVEYTITHCSLYLLSQNAPEKMNAVEANKDGSNGSDVVGTTATDSVNANSADAVSKASVNTADKTGFIVYMIGIIAGSLALVTVTISGKRRKFNK